MSRDFDGVDDLINCNTSSTLNNLSSMTVAVWMTPSSLGESLIPRILDKSDGASNGWMWVLGGGASESRQMGFRVFFAGGLLSVYAAGSPNFSYQEKFHVAVAWNGGTPQDSVTWYKNGIDVGNDAGGSAGSGARTSDTANVLTIGNDSGATRTFDGDLAHVQIFNRALNSGEVNQIMRFPGSITRGLVLYQRLEGFNSTEPDYSGRGNNGIVTGALKGAFAPAITGVSVFPRPNLWYATAITATTDATTGFYSKLSIDVDSKLSILSQTKLTLVAG